MKTKKYLRLSIAFALPIFATLIASPLNAKEEMTKEAPAEQQVDLKKVSEAFGHLIGKNLESLGFEFDINDVIQGMQDSIAGKESPLDESQCVEAISKVQETAFAKLSETNLEKANNFMEKNAKEAGIVALSDGKLHYKTEVAGTGAEVKAENTPLIRYKGSFLDGKVFGESKEDEIVSLEETIPGFSQGIVGMQEGEKRTLYIHPELGYGTSGFLPPNSLLAFEIEVVKAHVEKPAEDKLSMVDADIPSDMQEIAMPEMEENQATR